MAVFYRQEVTVARSETLNANPEGQNFAQDLSDLDYMHEPGLLHCMGMRYCGGDKHAQKVNSLYSTFIGAICVAINPFATPFFTTHPSHVVSASLAAFPTDQDWTSSTQKHNKMPT